MWVVFVNKLYRNSPLFTRWISISAGFSYVLYYTSHEINRVKIETDHISIIQNHHCSGQSIRNIRGKSNIILVPDQGAIMLQFEWQIKLTHVKAKWIDCGLWSGPMLFMRQMGNKLTYMTLFFIFYETLLNLAEYNSSVLSVKLKWIGLLYENKKRCFCWLYCVLCLVYVVDSVLLLHFYVFWEFFSVSN